MKRERSGIGGSDAAAIIGLNPYKSNVKLWREKTGRIEAEDISEKSYVKYGTNAEEPLRELFKLDFPEFEIKHEENTIIKHPKYPFLFASIDGTLIDKETGEMGILEIKTTEILQSMQKEKWKDRVPDNYYCQVLHYMNVTGYTFVKLNAQLKFSQEYKQTKTYTIKKEDPGVIEDMENLLKAEIQFWNEYVLKNIEPPLILPSI